MTRLIYPGSKLKTVEYLLHYKGLYTNEDRIQRYMDKFDKTHKETAIDLTFEHTKEILTQGDPNTENRKIISEGNNNTTY